MQGQGWALRLLRQCCGAPQGTAPRHGGTGGVQEPPRKQHHDGVAAVGPSGLARVLLERHCPVEHHLGRNRGSAQSPMAGTGCLHACVQAASLPPSHRAHLPLLTVRIHREVAQALKLELVKGSSGADRAVDQGIVHHMQGVLAEGTAQPTLLSSPQPSSPQLLFPLETQQGPAPGGVGCTRKWVPQDWVQEVPTSPWAHNLSCCPYSQG